ncbi:bacteriohemerythrin [Psychromonas sp. PT13]|uniref:bacteriohemerythrin n=1 Tax=Psychromonas sp. PT13 TaxID=3439547 RepID=UPI003EBA9E12
MAFIWDESFVTGYVDIDDQHYHLINLINAFGDFVKSGEHSEAVIKIVFDELYEYTSYHFKEEETVMELQGIAPYFLELHINIHKEFLSKVKQMHENVSIDEPATLQNLYDFLVHWLTNHILGIDKNTTAQINAIKNGCDAEDAFLVVRKEINKHLKHSQLSI